MHFLLGIGMYMMMDFMHMCSHRIPIACGGIGDLIILGDGTDLGIMVVGIHRIGSVVVTGVAIGEVIGVPTGDIIITGTVITCLTSLGVAIGENLMDGMAQVLVTLVFMQEDTQITFVVV